MSTPKALYCRISNNSNDTLAQVDAQERHGLAYAERIWPGAPLVIYRDEGISASKGLALPDRDRMLEDLRRGRFDGLWTVEQSRLTRKTGEWIAVRDSLRRGGLEAVHSSRDGLIPLTGAMSTIKAAINEDEAEKIRQRVRDRLADSRLQGIPHGGAVLGYLPSKLDDGTRSLQLDPNSAHAVRLAGERILAGWSLTSVTRAMVEAGVKGSRGGKLDLQTVRLLLAGWTVAGWTSHKGERLARGNWEPIFNDEEHAAIRARLLTKTGRRNPRKHLLTSWHLHCANCGIQMRCQPRKLPSGRVIRIYNCPPRLRRGRQCTSINAELLETWLLNEMWTALDDPAFLAAFNADDDDAERQRLLGELEASQRRRRTLAAQVAVGELDDDEWSAMRTAMKEHEADLNEQLAGLGEPTAVIDAGEARRGWDGLTLDEKRAFISKFVAGVFVFRAGRTSHRSGAERAGILWRSGEWQPPTRPGEPRRAAQAG